MNALIVLSILTLIFIVFSVLEYRVHAFNLNKIPIRIHVNGTRGKSSVTRLIAAGLRENGLKVFAKTTGTLPRMIMSDGREYPVYRPSKANIIEQIRIVALAADQSADALVIECMAVNPVYQSLTELKFIRATHGVITNARPDHLDVMGPNERDVALALLATTPESAKLFTCEQDYPEEFAMACADRKSKLFTIAPEDISSISDEEMERFSYVEHKENVALALKVCGDLGVSRDIALRGMVKALPDAGAMREYNLEFFGRKYVFVNGFAANDPESSKTIWCMALGRHKEYRNKIMILNTRSDRPDRSRQIGEALIHWPLANNYLVIGDGAYVLVRTAVANGMDASQFTYGEGMGTERIFEEIVGLAGESAMIMGIGNIAGPGLELITYFKNRAATNGNGKVNQEWKS